MVLPLLLAFGCAPEEAHPLHATVSSALSPACIANVMEAEAWWADQLGQEQVFSFMETDVMPENPGYREVLIARFMGDLENGKLAGHATARYDRSGRVYHGGMRLRDNPGNLEDRFNCSVKTVAHEIGHVLGLGHRQERGAVMSNYSDGMELNADELARAAIGAGEL